MCLYTVTILDYSIMMNLKINLNSVRCLSMIEGISYILLMGIGMPFKYIVGIGYPNQILGLIHGILSVVFLLVLVCV